MLVRLSVLGLVGIIFCSSWAAFGGVGGVLLSMAVLCVTAYIRCTVGWSLLMHLSVLATLLLVTIALLMPVCSGAREAARRAQCLNNLKQIALALLNYEAEHHSFPPAFVADKDGRPMHSWRVLILPYLDQRSLYERYNLDEPWDSVNNRRLLVERPSVYACPSDQDVSERGSTCASYLAVSGANAAWKGNKGASITEIRSQGGAENTILVVESADSGIAWTEPRDLSVDDLDAADPSSKVKLHASHMRDNGYFYHPTPNCIDVAFADGSVHLLPANALTAERLKSLLAIGGCNETVMESLAQQANGNADLLLNWPHCVGLPIWLTSAVILLILAAKGRRAARRRDAARPA